jgi:hypothetical protein
MARWADIVDFEVHGVITSEEAARKIAPRLEVMEAGGNSPAP